MAVLFYADYASPYCYLQEWLVESLEAETAVVERRAFELWPEGRSADAGAADDEWRIAEAIARRLAAPFRRSAHRPRTRKAHEAAAFARGQDRFADMHRAIYRAHYVEGSDIGRVDVLAGIGASIGLDPLTLRIALDVDGFTDDVVRAESAAYEAGITAVPVLARGEERLTGLQPRGVLRAFLQAEQARQQRTDEG